MAPLAHDALELLEKARSEIKAAQTASGSQRLLHYRAAKKVLVSIGTKVVTAPLSGMVIAYEDLAKIFDHSGDQKRATKCRKRADALRPAADKNTKTLAATNSSSLITPPSSAVPTVIGTTTSTTSAVNTSPASRELTPSPVSVSAAAALVSPPSFFSKDIKTKPYVCSLPGQNEPFETTRQLAFCLALLRPSIQEHDLSPENLEWRRKTLENQEEKARLENLSEQLIKAFAKDVMKRDTMVIEVIQLAPVLSSDDSRFLIKTFIDAVHQSHMLDFHSLEGLAMAIQGAASESCDSDDLVRVLGSLHRKLQSTHSQSDRSRYRLLVTISHVLDGMVDARIGDVQVDLHGPLTELLRESEKESGDNPYLAYQAAYATQALLNVSDNENIWSAGFKRGWLVLKGAAGCAEMPDLTQVKDYLDGLETLYKALTGGARLLKDAVDAIKNNERPTFTVKEGLKFKRAWYWAVRTAESYLEIGKLVEFKELVMTAPCRDQLMFQWGICQLLRQFAADTEWDPEAQQDAIEFLRALYKDKAIWDLQEKVDEVIFDAITSMAQDNEASKSFLEEMKKRNPNLEPTANLKLSPWKNILPVEPAEASATKSSLLKDVQARSSRHANLENIQHRLSQSSFDSDHSTPKSSQETDIVNPGTPRSELSFVNLALEGAPENQEKERQDMNRQMCHTTKDVPDDKDVSAGNEVPDDKGVPLCKNTSNEKDTTKDHQTSTDDANKKEAAKQFAEGLKFHAGYGVQKNCVIARNRYLKANKLGHVDAPCVLGTMYRDGDGFQKDLRKAVDWYSIAAQRGNALAYYNLGMMYHNGVDIFKDYPKVMGWFKKTADLSHSDDNGASQNHQLAMALWKKAADLGNAEAKKRLDALPIAV
ncbi:uncharacterized protein EMPS_01641 [Entomortierella parvispora]|uniref:Arm-like repeat domain-containing protein n=1 Tax=Entomortierella parvispora TaxID=205924 RepID=A0A9P3LT54_9FUNG|nr:uncharacterized protein EMPS_01641 [Entomortierella parvispora]